jgi:hypothetical protein
MRVILGFWAALASEHSMSSLQRFEADLKHLLDGATDLRPFVCDGSPLDCRAVVAGFNPATTLGPDLWQFWSPGYGFEKPEWLASYQRQRLSLPLPPGKTRRSALSNTRRVLGWITNAAAPVRCLETNIYATGAAQDVGRVHPAVDLPGADDRQA